MVESPPYQNPIDLESLAEPEIPLTSFDFGAIWLPVRRSKEEEEEVARREAEDKSLEDHSLVRMSCQLDNQENDHSKKMDMLIPHLGRDISISCLLHCSRSGYNVIASLNKAFRSLIRNGELYKLRRKMGIVEHWIYFTCDLPHWDVFDPVNLKWMTLPNMTSNPCFMCSHKQALAIGTELFVFGRDITSQLVYKYSILTNTWSIVKGLNTPRSAFGSASLGEIAIIAGGCEQHGKLLKSAEIYNSETDMWEPIPSMHNARKACSAVFMDGKFYVIGGRGESHNVLTTAEVYDLTTSTWKEIPDIFPIRDVASAEFSAPPLVAVVNNEMYAVDHFENKLKKYDKERNSWKTLGGLPRRVTSVHGWGLAFEACGDQLILIGGPRLLDERMIEINAWVPNEEGPPEWELLGRRNSGWFVHNSAVMGC